MLSQSTGHAQGRLFDVAACRPGISLCPGHMYCFSDLLVPTKQKPLVLQVNIVTNVTVTGIDISQLLSQALAPNGSNSNVFSPLQQQLRVDPAQSVNITPTNVAGQNQVWAQLICTFILMSFFPLFPLQPDPPGMNVAVSRVTRPSQSSACLHTHFAT